MSKQSWKGSTLLNPEPPVLVSCGGLDKPNLITIGWTGTICTQPSMVSISVRPERYSHHLIRGSGQFAINLPTEALVKSVDWCGVRSQTHRLQPRRISGSGQKAGDLRLQRAEEKADAEAPQIIL